MADSDCLTAMQWLILMSAIAEKERTMDYF